MLSEGESGRHGKSDGLRVSDTVLFWLGNHPASYMTPEMFLNPNSQLIKQFHMHHLLASHKNSTVHLTQNEFIALAVANEALHDPVSGALSDLILSHTPFRAFCSFHTGLLTVPQMRQEDSCPRAFALTVFSLYALSPNLYTSHFLHDDACSNITFTSQIFLVHPTEE